MSPKVIDWSNLTGHTALITGASSGIGAALALHLAQRGADPILVARSADRLREVAAHIQQRTGRVPLTITHDLSREQAAISLAGELRQRGRNIDILVNNAGATSLTPVHLQSFDDQHAMVTLNVAAVADLTRLLLPGMRQRHRGAVINIASGGAFRPTANMAVYAASKAFVLSYTEALWAEQQQAACGVQVLAVCPGPTQTAALVEAASGPVATPEHVAAITLRALEKGRMTVVDGRRTRLQTLLFRFLPRRTVATAVARATTAIPAKMLAG